jgi:hypothetical protein
MNLEGLTEKRNKYGTVYYENSVGTIVAKVCTECGKGKSCIDSFARDARGLGERVSKCKDCNTEYREQNKARIAETSRRYRDINREKISENKRKYRESNREKESTRSKTWRESNKERCAELSRKYYESNRNRVIERSRNWYESNKERASVRGREYREENYEQVREGLRIWREALYTGNVVEREWHYCLMTLLRNKCKQRSNISEGVR